MEISSTRSSLNVSHATKRQKLEDGYFCNVCGNFYFNIYLFFNWHSTGLLGMFVFMGEGNETLVFVHEKT